MLLSKLNKLGEAFIKDPSLIHNHSQTGVLRDYKKAIQEDINLLDAIKNDSSLNDLRIDLECDLAEATVYLKKYLLILREINETL